MDQQDLERVKEQLEKTFKAVIDLDRANKVASQSIYKLDHELRVMEQKLAEMEARDKKLEKGGE